MKKVSTRRFPRSFPVLAGLLIFAGCSGANKSGVDFVLRPTGFLSDYSRLAPSTSIEGAYVAANPNKRLSIYRMFMIEPIQTPSAPGVNLTHKAAAELKNEFESEIRAALGPSFPIVTQPGFGVLKLRLAVNGANTSPLTGYSVTASTLEGEFIDSTDNKQVVAFVASPEARPSRFVSTVGELSPSHLILRRWAMLMRDRLDATSGLHTGDELKSYYRPSR